MFVFAWKWLLPPIALRPSLPESETAGLMHQTSMSSSVRIWFWLTSCAQFGDTKLPRLWFLSCGCTTVSSFYAEWFHGNDTSSLFMISMPLVINCLDFLALFWCFSPGTRNAMQADPFSLIHFAFPNFCIPNQRSIHTQILNPPENSGSCTLHAVESVNGICGWWTAWTQNNLLQCSAGIFSAPGTHPCKSWDKVRNQEHTFPFSCQNNELSATSCKKQKIARGISQSGFARRKKILSGRFLKAFTSARKAAKVPYRLHARMVFADLRVLANPLSLTRLRNWPDQQTFQRFCFLQKNFCFSWKAPQMNVTVIFDNLSLRAMLFWTTQVYGHLFFSAHHSASIIPSSRLVVRWFTGW